VAKTQINHPELRIGARVRGTNGILYTRIARLNRSDWISEHGKQYAAIPVTWEPVHQPPKDELDTAFAVTPVLKADDHGFGIVADTDLQPGDTIFTPGFRKQQHTIREVGTVHRWWKQRTILITTKGDWYYPASVVYIARNLGPNPHEYTRWDQ
jgi:hypothetical protein